MTDIYDIKELYFKGNEGFFLSLIVFFSALFYYIYFSFFVKNNSKKIQDKEILEEKIDFKKQFIDFENNISKYNSKVFLQNLSYLFKSYLEKEQNIQNITKMTLEEIKNIELGSNIFEIFKELYFLEYMEQEVDLNKRKEIFSNTKIIVFND